MRLQVVTDMENSGVSRHRALKAAMAANGLQLFRVAQKVGVSDGNLSHILNGNRIASPEMLDRIEEAIGDLAEAATA